MANATTTDWVMDSCQKSASKRPPSGLKASRLGQSSAYGCSPAGSDQAASISRSGIKTAWTPGQGLQASAGGGCGSSGRFSFSKCSRLSRTKNSPCAFLKQLQQQQSGTPNLFLDKQPQQQQQQQQDSGAGADVDQAKDGGEKSGMLLDIDLLQCNSPAAIDAAITGLSDQQRQVQRLLCNPRILEASDEAFAVLRQLPALSFLILSLDGYDGGSRGGGGSGADLWPGLSRLMSALRHVVCLDVSNCLMQDQHLKVISQSCPQLRALDLSYSPDVSETGLGCLLAACPQLEELDISTCRAASSDQLLHNLGRCCPNLSSLYIELDAKFRAAGDEPAEEAASRGVVSWQALAELAGSCPRLQALSLAGLPMAASPAPGGPAMAAFLQACPQLSSLDISGCTWPAAADWQALAGCSSLHTLALSGGAGFDDHAAGRVAAGCQALSSLRLYDCPLLTDEGLGAAVQALPELAELSIVNCPLLGPSLAEALEQAHAQLHVSQHSSDGHDDDDDYGADQGMEMDASPHPAAAGARGAAAAGAVEGDDPMSIMKAPASEPEAAGAAGPGGDGPSWSSLMSFLTNHTGDMAIASCQKARRPGN